MFNKFFSLNDNINFCSLYHPQDADAEFYEEFITNISPAKFSDILILFEIANHSYLPTNIDCNLVYREYRGFINKGDRRDKFYEFVLISGINSIGEYNVSFGKNSPLWQGYAFITGGLYFTATVYNTFNIKHLQVNLKG